MASFRQPWPISSRCSGAPSNRHGPRGWKRWASTWTATSSGRWAGASSRRFRTPESARFSCIGAFSAAVPGFDRLDAVREGLLEAAPADAPEHEPQEAPLQVLALADHDVVDVGCAVGLAREVVRMAGIAAPRIRVGGLHHDVVRVGPVVVLALPDAARTLGHVGLAR